MGDVAERGRRGSGLAGASVPRALRAGFAGGGADDLAETLPLGPDPERYTEQVRAYVDAGFTHVYFHQVGPDQEGFFRFWQDELRGRL